MLAAERAQGLIGIARSMLGVSIGVSLFALANGGNFALIAVAMSDAGAGEALVGLSTSTYFLGTLIASLTCSHIVARLGYVRAFALFAGIAAATTATIALVEPVWIWPLLRSLTGFGIGGIYVVLDSWFNHATDNDNRGRTYAFYETVRLTSVSLGSFLFIAASAWLGASVFLATAFLYLAAVVPVSLNRLPQPERGGAPQARFLSLLRMAPLGIACCTVGGLTTGAIYGLVPLFGKESGLTTAQLSAFVFFSHFGAFVFQLPSGHLADRLGRRGIIVGLGVLCAGAALVLGLTEQPGVPLLMLGGLVTGGICHTINMLGVIYTNDRLDPSAYLGAAAGLLIAYDIGTVSGPLIAAAAMAALGKGGLYLFIAALMGTIVVLAGLRPSPCAQGCCAAD